MADQVSVVRRCYETETTTVTLEKVFEAIKTGAKDLKPKITQIRNRYEAELDMTGSKEKARKAVAELKNELPGFLPSGVFSERANDKLVEYSGLLCADLDDIGAAKARELKEVLKSFVFIRAAAISPTGVGLKVFFNVINDPTRHMDSFRAIQESVRESLGLEIDEKCKDPARICFLTYDPDVWIRTEGNETHPPADPLPRGNPIVNSGNPVAGFGNREQIAFRLLGELRPAPDKGGYFVNCPGGNFHSNKSGEKHTIIYLSSVPTLVCQHTSCSPVIDAFNKVLRSEIGKSEFLQSYAVNAQRPLTAYTASLSDERNGESTDLTALTASLPKPKMGTEAYYGLAGEIVDKMLPHSEADPVALLIQLLIGFGSMIGRTSHCLVGGSPHFMNMFAVLIGDTSSGRKGMSWSAILNLLLRHCGEAGWVDNITGGMSSGEGLISAIKDPVTKMKDGVEHEIEPGVSDKRLLVVEGEFARVMKVMQREQNTLSSIIRTAWDSMPLRTLTKSPYRASGAHISILGHITPEEIRHWMNEIEAANGFGNRFLWPYVERSKLLPEGASPPDMSGVIEELIEAISFAKSGHVLSRDDEAKELWASVYPGLTEGRTGLSGSLIARATAQTLRLSAIYALIDVCNTVNVKHLQAAIAVWKYCQDSVYYIFKRGTGNSDSDKILTALMAAGKKGMSRDQIRNDVFSRNATKHQIDEALRLLASLKYAYCKEESTGGRPAQIWFAT